MASPFRLTSPGHDRSATVARSLAGPAGKATPVASNCKALERPRPDGGSHNEARTSTAPAREALREPAASRIWPRGLPIRQSERPRHSALPLRPESTRRAMTADQQLFAGAGAVAMAAVVRSVRNAEQAQLGSSRGCPPSAGPRAIAFAHEHSRSARTYASAAAVPNISHARARLLSAQSANREESHDRSSVSRRPPVRPARHLRVGLGLDPRAIYPRNAERTFTPRSGSWPVRSSAVGRGSRRPGTLSCGS
jgi:hypothetical protein